MVKFWDGEMNKDFIYFRCGLRNELRPIILEFQKGKNKVDILNFHLQTD